MIERLTDRALSPVSLAIPCRPEYVALCRLVAGALGTRDGLDEEVLADIKMIVTEACDCLLAMAADMAASTGAFVGDPKGAADPACHIRMDFDSRPDAFVISVLYPDKRELLSWLKSCDSLSQAGLGLTILEALTDDIVELPDAEGTILRLTKRLPA